MSSYRGSVNTFAMVKEQIDKRFGPVEAEAYDPNSNCLTLHQWNALGYKVKKGEHALRSFTFVGHDDENDKATKKRWRKSVFLFCRVQVEKKGEPSEDQL